MKLVDLSITDFTAELASHSPAPGGGTISAVTGAFAAGLGSMVCALTIGNPKYPESQERLPTVKARLNQAQAALLQLADEDTAAFDQVMAAFRLPKDSEEEKAARKSRIAEANLEATRVPMRTAAEAVAVAELLPEVLRLGNTNAVSDCGVAMECAHTAARGALMNVAINLPGVKDETASSELRAQREALADRAERFYAEGVTLMNEKLN